MTTAKGGRPNTPSGHRDDAMLAFLEYRGDVEKLGRMDQVQYRERRDLLAAMNEHLRDAALSWRYAEIMEDIVAAQADEVAK